MYLVDYVSLDNLYGDYYDLTLPVLMTRNSTEGRLEDHKTMCLLLVNVDPNERVLERFRLSPPPVSFPPSI